MLASSTTKRLRVFAGPNGSGKSTIIDSIRKYKINNRQIDFGIYINADDIAQSLLKGSFSFGAYELQPLSRHDFVAAVLQTGLIRNDFPEEAFKSCFTLNAEGVLKLKTRSWCEHLAQAIASVLRDKLLEQNRKLSFETVFSHPSKLEFMQRAVTRGYKVYLYFIATESPEINIARIKEVRVLQGGHDVSEDKIKKRYTRSLDLLFNAADMAYQAYFFDNSVDGAKNKAEYFAHFKVIKGKKVWDPINPKTVPTWFVEYYLGKI